MTKQPVIHSLEVVHADRLSSRSLGRAKPFLVSGIRAAPAHWSVSYIVEKAGDIAIPVACVNDGDYRQATSQTMSVGNYVDQLKHSEQNDASAPYLAELSYDEHFPDLARELVSPPNLRGEKFTSRVMYLGKTVNSQIHYHPRGSAMLFCIAGRKLVRLYAPTQGRYLYPVPGTNFSEVLGSATGLSAPEYDKARYPEFAKAKYIEVLIEPGDVLMIPIYWWHGIQNFDEISLTAVYFWHRLAQPWPKQLLPEHWPPAGRRARYFKSKYKRILDRLRPKPR